MKKANHKGHAEAQKLQDDKPEVLPWPLPSIMTRGSYKELYNMKEWDVPASIQSRLKERR